MSKCLLVYYSQGGSTGRIAESVAKGLRAQGHTVDLHNLKDGPAPGPGDYDLLGVGTPAYYYRPPFLVTDHLKSVPALAGKPFFVFAVYGAYLGDTGNAVRRALEQRGGKETGYARYRGAGYFIGYLKQGYLPSPGHPKPDTVAQAEQFGREVAARLGGKEYRKADYDAPTHVVYRIERFLTNRLFARQIFSRLFHVDRKKCTACGLCARTCPTHNVREDKEGRPAWGRNCILCFSCEMKCPTDAINSRVTWFLFWPFLVYNVWRLSRDPGLEKVRVKHAQGRTRVIGE
jgi:flavodoxin/NAD-dependent dihydropyrimidine dehydrogenase PreA subunit